MYEIIIMIIIEIIIITREWKIKIYFEKILSKKVLSKF